MEIKEVWRKSMEYIQGELAEVSFETWFLSSQLKPEGMIKENDDRIIFLIRINQDSHSLSKNILEQRYSEMINSVVSSISGMNLTVKFMEKSEQLPSGLIFSSFDELKEKDLAGEQKFIFEPDKEFYNNMTFSKEEVFSGLNSLDLELFEGEEAGLAIIPDKYPRLMHIVILQRDYSGAVNKYDFQVTKMLIVKNLIQIFELPELKPDEIIRIIKKMREDDNKESRHMCDEIFNDRMLSLFMTFLGSGHFRNTIHYFTYEDAVMLLTAIYSLLPLECCCYFDQVRLKDSAVEKMNNHIIISSDLNFGYYNLQDASPVVKKCILNDRSRCAFIKAMEIAGRSGFCLSDQLAERTCELILKEAGLPA